MADTEFTSSYVLTDAILETFIGANPKAAAVALKAASASTQLWYCQEATRSIDRLPLQGYKLTSSQARQFPRKYDPSYPISWSPWGNIVTEDAYGYIYMSTSVPQDVIDACCEEAIAIYAFGSDTDNIDREAMKDNGVQNYNLGGVYSENLKSSFNDLRGLRSREAYKLLEKYIENSVCCR